MTLQLKSTGEFIIEELDWNYSNEEINNLITEEELVVTNNSISFSGEIKWEFNSEGTETTVYNISGGTHEVVKLYAQ